MSCGVIPLILLQSADRQHAPIVPSQSVAHSVLTKHTTLNTLSHTIQEALQVRPALEIAKNATPLLTPQEEKVLSMWMDGVSNNAIAAALSIHGKTVYTYKRNIRMKLHPGTASRRSCHSQGRVINGTTRRRTVLHYCYC